MNSSVLSRRTVLQLAGAAALPLSSGVLSRSVQAAAPGTLTIAYNVNLPSFDPTVGLSAVNPTIQSIYQAIFDPYIGQAPDLSFKPGRRSRTERCGIRPSPAGDTTPSW